MCALQVDVLAFSLLPFPSPAPPVLFLPPSPPFPPFSPPPTREIVELLLNNSASLLVHDLVSKRTPLHAAAGNGHNDTVQVILKNITNSTHIDCVDFYER